jgi:uncharacterized membrane protein
MAMTPFITALTNHPGWLRETLAFVASGTLFVFALAFIAAFGG